jgi:B9 domain-containing protein 2
VKKISATSAVVGEIRTRQSRKDAEIEVNLIAEIALGKGFFNLNPFFRGFHCEWAVWADPQWMPLTRQTMNPADTTQTCYPGYARTTVWDHPIDLHYACTQIDHWPTLKLKVFAVDRMDKARPVGYGCVTLPTEPGNFEIRVQTWRPAGDSFWEELGAKLTGHSPKELSEDSLIEERWF